MISSCCDSCAIEGHGHPIFQMLECKLRKFCSAKQLVRFYSKRIRKEKIFNLCTIFICKLIVLLGNSVFLISGGLKAAFMFAAALFCSAVEVKLFRGRLLIITTKTLQEETVKKMRLFLINKCNEQTEHKERHKTP